MFNLRAGLKGQSFYSSKGGKIVHKNFFCQAKEKIKVNGRLNNYNR